jgi:formylglycine-generating enzyme required for sulfatase activity
LWLADTPCTQALWVAVMGENLSRFKGPRRPVERVSWEDVQRFIRQLEAQVDGLRLPTEAEWEYACRAGTSSARYAAQLEEIAWFDVNSEGGTHEVGLKRPNAWGLQDMLGNVWEWCADGWRSYESAKVIDPCDNGPYRVFRGGAWSDSARLVRAAFRSAVPPGSRDGSLGFRLARGQAQQGRQAGESG